MSAFLGFTALVAFYIFSSSALGNDVPEKQSNTNQSWTDNPSTRGTWNILFSCLFTIFACTWNVVHPDIMASPSSGFRNLLGRARRMIITLILPESILSFAIVEKFHARQDFSSFKRLENSGLMAKWKFQEKRSWLQKWRTFAGYNKKPINEIDSSHLWTMTHTRYLNMGGLILDCVDPEHPNRIETYAISGHAIADPNLFDPSYSPLMKFSISQKEILDKSKEDGLSKLVALIQILRLVISIITRKARDLSTSQLEILTLNFAVQAVITYIFQWDKPKDISVPSKIHLEKLSDDKKKAKLCATRLRQTSAISLRKGNEYVSMAVLGFAILFGGLHCLAWNFAFPSRVEQVMWRIGSTLLTSLPAICICSLAIDSLVTERQYGTQTEMILWYTVFLVYFIARLTIIGIAFSCLRSMPADVYQTTWSKYIPNIE